MVVIDFECELVVIGYFEDCGKFVNFVSVIMCFECGWYVYDV